MTVGIERDERGRALSLHCTDCGAHAIRPPGPVAFDPSRVPEWIWDAGFRLNFYRKEPPAMIHLCPEREEEEAG